MVAQSRLRGRGASTPSLAGRDILANHSRSTLPAWENPGLRPGSYYRQGGNGMTSFVRTVLREIRPSAAFGLLVLFIGACSGGSGGGY